MGVMKMTAENAAAVNVTGDAVATPEKAVEKRRALGRGLESLLPSGPRVVGGTAMASAAVATPATAGEASFDSAQDRPAPHGGVLAEVHAQAARGDTVKEIALDLIDNNPYQTRHLFRDDMLDELAESIKASGVVQPIVVRPGEGERYVLVLGERRCRASKLAGKETIPAIVRRISDQQAAEMTVVENLQRQDLNCMEQAAAFAKLSLNFGLTQDEIGKRVGVARETVSNYMRLLKLPGTVMKYLQDGDLGYSEARLLLQFQEPEVIAKIADEAVKQHLSVEGVEQLCIKAWVREEPKEPRLGKARWVDPNVRAAQTQMERALGVKVRIRDRKGKGKIVIEYATIEDFDRVVEMLKGKK
jgi:ParB family transcriptional regulator, chromosome partitioning protein